MQAILTSGERAAEVTDLKRARSLPGRHNWQNAAAAYAAAALLAIVPAAAQAADTAVSRQSARGTGGSSGAPYLRSRLGLHYYPMLWELRSHL